MVPYQSCLVVTTPRTGSWMLSDALFATGLIGRPDEYFQPQGGWIYYREWGLPDRPRITDVVTKAVEAETSSNGVFGAKLHWSQWRWFIHQLRGAARANAKLDQLDLIRRYLPPPRYVYLYRRDVARQTISYYRAIETQIWHVRVDEPNPSPLPEDFEPDFARIRWWEQMLTNHDQNWRQLFARSGTPFEEVVYEDFVTDYAGTVARILRFLDLPDSPESIPPESNLARLTDETSERWLEGYLAVRDQVEPNPPVSGQQSARRPAATATKSTTKKTPARTKKAAAKATKSPAKATKSTAKPAGTARTRRS